ncbi:MAG: hypothetical protein AAFV53_26720, partial [Myxococcota bacterium]
SEVPGQRAHLPAAPAAVTRWLADRSASRASRRTIQGIEDHLTAGSAACREMADAQQRRLLERVRIVLGEGAAPAA